MSEGLTVTVCQYEGCKRKFRLKKKTQRYCSKTCSYAQRLIRQKGRVDPDYKRPPRTQEYRSRLIDWQQAKRRESTRLFHEWERFVLRQNTSLKTLLRLFRIPLSSDETSEVTEKWLTEEFKRKRNSLLKMFHPTARYWRVRQISSRRPEVRQKRLEAVCGKIQHAYHKALVVIHNKKNPRLFFR